MSARFINRALILGALLACTAVSACGTCGEEMTGQETSPDRAYTATTYVRNCGATTSYVTHVNVHRTSKSLRAAWDGAVREGEVVSIKGNDRVNVKWLNPRSVEVRVRSIDAATCRESLADIHIRCVSLR
jgi:hypothetical protein